MIISSVPLNNIRCRYCDNDNFTLMVDKSEGENYVYIYHYGNYDCGCRQRIPLTSISYYVVGKDISTPEGEEDVKDVIINQMQNANESLQKSYWQIVQKMLDIERKYKGE